MYATYTTTYEQPTTQQSYNNNFYESKGHTNSSNFGGSSIMSNDSIKTIKATTRTVGIGAWILLGTVVLGAYHMCSDGDFSFLMTLSSMCSAFGMIMLCLQVATSQSFAGISLKSLQLQAGTFFFRFLSTLFHDGYLPLDSSGDFIYRFAEFSALAAACGGLYMAYAKFNRTYEKEKDSFGNFGPTGGDRMVGTLGEGIVFKCDKDGTLNTEYLEEILVDNFNANYEQFPRVMWTFGYGNGQKKSLQETVAKGTAFEIFLWYYPGTCADGYCAGRDPANDAETCMADAKEAARDVKVPVPRAKELVRLQETLHTHWGTALNKKMIKVWLADIIKQLTGHKRNASPSNAPPSGGVSKLNLATVDAWFQNIMDKDVDIFVDNRYSTIVHWTF